MRNARCRFGNLLYPFCTLISVFLTGFFRRVNAIHTQRNVAEKTCLATVFLYTGGAAIAVPLPVLLILSLPMAGQREELYSLKGATLPYRYAHPVR